MNSPSVWVLLLLSFSLLACGQGPKLTYCISDPEKNVFRCHDQKKNKGFKRTPERMVEIGSTCLHPDEATEMLDACADKRPLPKRNQCIVGEASEQFMFHCFDQLSQQDVDIPFAETENYVCLSVEDFFFLFDYCARRRERK